MKVETKKVGRVVGRFGTFDAREVAELAAAAREAGCAWISHRETDRGPELYFEKDVRPEPDA